MTTPDKLRIGFFASGGGSNMQAVFDACNLDKLAMQPAVVITNISTAGAVQRAKNQNIPVHHISKKTHPENETRNQAILDVLQSNKVDIIVLAGYLQKIEAPVLQAFESRIINIHPALLPKHGGEGMHGHFVHEAVIAHGDKESGPTVHLVDEFYDHGQILMQTRIPVLDNDTPEELAARVLMFEYPTMVATLQGIASGKIELPGLELK